MIEQAESPEIDVNNELFPNWLIFLMLATMHFLVSLLANEYLFTRELYFSLFSDQTELIKIDKYVDLIKRFSFWSMLTIPLFLFLKYSITALLVQIPLLIKCTEISFRYLFRWVMFASIALLIGQMIHFTTIYFTPISDISQNLFKLKPYSLARLINSIDYPVSTLIVLNQCSLFEFAWLLILYIGLLKTGKISKSDAGRLLFYIWVTLMFLSWFFYFFIPKII